MSSLLGSVLTYGVLPYLTLLITLTYAYPFGAACLAFLSSIIICGSYGVVASIVCNLIGKPGLSQWTTARSFKWVFGVQTGCWFVVEEEERGVLGRRPGVFMSNHQSELDVAVIGAVFPRYISVTAKKSLKYFPILGQFMSLSNSVFIDRANHASARAAFDSAVKHMRSARQSVFIFPEGTRSYSSEPSMLPFKKGGFHLAVQAQVPIIPVVVENYAHVLSFKKRTWRPSAGPIRIRVLKAIETEGRGATKEDVDQLVLEVRGRMERVLGEMSAERKVTLGNGVAGGLREKAKIALANGSS